MKKNKKLCGKLVIISNGSGRECLHMSILFSNVNAKRLCQSICMWIVNLFECHINFYCRKISCALVKHWMLQRQQPQHVHGIAHKFVYIVLAFFFSFVFSHTNIYCVRVWLDSRVWIETDSCQFNFTIHHFNGFGHIFSFLFLLLLCISKYIVCRSSAYAVSCSFSRWSWFAKCSQPIDACG